MRFLFLAIAGAALAIALPAAAQDTAITSTPKGSAPAATLAQGANQPGTAGHDNTAMQQKLRQDLEQAGFKDVRVMPESFLVRANDKEGRPVMMIINPDSVTEITRLGTNGSGMGNAGRSGSTMSPGTPSTGSTSGAGHPTGTTAPK